MAPGARNFLEATKLRRSIYQLSAKSPIPDSRIVEIVTHALIHTPSTFNTQSTRAIVVFRENHTKLWDSIINVVRPSMPAEKWEGYAKARFEGFEKAYGTVLFYEQQGAVESLKSMFAKTTADKEKIQSWQDVTNGMHQYVVWTALANEGLGANLQHHNPQIDGVVAKQLDVPEGWELKAQLVFGTPVGGPKEKDSKPIEERLKVFGARD